MAAEFEQVAWVTFAILALVVGAMVGLNAVGVAQVRECRTLVAIRKMYHTRNTCVSGSLAGSPSRFAIEEAKRELVGVV